MATPRTRHPDQDDPHSPVFPLVEFLLAAALGALLVYAAPDFYAWIHGEPAVTTRAR